MTLQDLSCNLCNHDLNLHGKNGCAVMIDNVDSCPCESGCK